MSCDKRFSGGTLSAILANFVICQYEYSSIICDDSCGQRLSPSFHQSPIRNINSVVSCRRCSHSSLRQRPCSIQSSKDGEGEGRGAAMSTRGLTEGGVPLGDWLSPPSPMRAAGGKLGEPCPRP